MATTTYQTVNFTSESVPQDKLQQLANNQQWIFDNMSKIRYVNGGITRDNAKVLTGRAVFPARTDNNYLYLTITFGNYFSAGCKPIVIASLEVLGGSMHRAKMVIQGRESGAGIDHTGFIAVVTGDTYRALSSGWITYQAVGY